MKGKWLRATGHRQRCGSLVIDEFLANVYICLLNRLMSPQPNPYSVAPDAGEIVVTEEPRRFWGGLLLFVRVGGLSVIWMVVLFFASAIAIGSLSGIYFFFRAFLGDTPAEMSSSIGGAWVVIPEAVALLGLALGLLGKLPGTRR